MALTFYPHEDDLHQEARVEEKLDVLLEAAERYKAAVLEMAKTEVMPDSKKRVSPREQTLAYNWEEIAKLLREIRELPESNKADKLKKANLLTKLAEIYEVLRGAKMAKLEAVRVALISEANQLRGGSTQVA